MNTRGLLEHSSRAEPDARAEKSINSLYVSGGRQKKRLLKEDEEWTLYDKAMVLQVDVNTGDAQVCVEYATPAEARPHAESSVLFKAGTLQDNRLYTCTSTEVLTYDLPSFRLLNYLSLPCFNDLHHVRPTPGGNILIANTGLDMVVECSQQGHILREWNVVGGDPWVRFSRAVDYRKVDTTKPHHAHPNFVFLLGDDIWVTRAEQKDAVCLTRHQQPISLADEVVHDGHPYRGMIYFTAVDGRLILVDQESLQVADVINLKSLDGGNDTLLGWCRGLWVVDERHVWVGFTRVRKTSFMEKVNWVKRVRDVQTPAHIALYDIVKKKRLKEINVEKYGMNVVFNMFPALATPNKKIL